MVTDLGRRNISRMCAELGVENIIVAADIEKKRRISKKTYLLGSGRTFGDDKYFNSRR